MFVSKKTLNACSDYKVNLLVPKFCRDVLKNTRIKTIIVFIILLSASIGAFGCSASTSKTAADPNEFSIIWITDTQYLARFYPADFDAQCSWIVNNSAILNLKAVIHTGDIVDGQASIDQWINANHSMSILLDNNIPYCWDAGNHDKSEGASWYGKYYTALNVTVGREKPYWVSDYYDGKNTAIRLKVANLDILIINIEYQADNAVLEWANNLLDSNPQSIAIVGTHAYLQPSLNYEQWAINFKNQVLDAHPNVFLVLSGHYHVPAGNRTTVNNRNELMFDRQDEDNYEGGATIRILSFDTIKNAINVSTYLPYTDQYLTDSNSQFIIPMIPSGPKLTLTVNPQAVTRGSSLQISGQLSLAQTATIHLFYRYPEQTGRWKLATTFKTNTAGAYGKSVTVPTSLSLGNYDLVAVWFNQTAGTYVTSQVTRLAITNGELLSKKQFDSA